jgi:hypothetical protein
MPEGAWFVGLHVREGTDRMHDVRNSDISTYRLAVEEIAKRGGWVLRMGDRSMRPWPNTIDYAHSAERKDWMDVFLWAEGRFFIGTGSRPQLIPQTFGKPVAIANWGPLGGIVCTNDDHPAGETILVAEGWALPDRCRSGCTRITHTENPSTPSHQWASVSSIQPGGSSRADHRDDGRVRRLA